MKIAVFGLGYVGCVAAGCLARNGHWVCGVDINPEKMRQMESGRAPLVEPGLDGLISKAVASGRLQLSANGAEAACRSDVSLICVGTPNAAGGALDHGYVEAVSREIGAGLGTRQGYHVVVVRSTVLPGTVRERIIPLLEKTSGKRAGADFGVSMNPEFLREHSAIEDYDHPGQVVIGQLDPRSGDTVARLYQGVNAPLLRTEIEVAEMLKLVNNAFHGLKVAFANEVGTLCKKHGIDSREVMDFFCLDRRLNISPAYLRPGFAFGGSCLPKDLRALLFRARERGVDTPLLDAILVSNETHVRRVIEMIERTQRRKVGIVGLSFKAGTDDVRESPAVNLIKALLAKGYDVSVYDENVDPDRLMGANKRFLEEQLPRIANLLCSSVEDLVQQAEVVVRTHGGVTHSQLRSMMDEDQTLIDLEATKRRSSQR